MAKCTECAAVAQQSCAHCSDLVPASALSPHELTGVLSDNPPRRPDRQTYGQTDRGMYRQTGRQADRQAGRQIDRQTDMFRSTLKQMTNLKGAAPGYSSAGS